MRQSNPPVALVTGAAHGIGKAIAERLAGDGYAVALLDVNAEQCVREAERIGKRFDAATLALNADTAVEADIVAMYRELNDAFGRLDAIVNNAGIPDPTTAPLEELDRTTWDRYLEVNLTGYYLIAKHGIRMLRKTRGAIVNMASVHALQSDKHHNMAYAASKGGIIAFTHALAMSEGPEVRVNCISPGWIDVRDADEKRHLPLREIDHSQHPVGRAGLPEDVSAMTAFLLSDDAAFITAQNIVVDGGMTRRMGYAE